MSEDSDTFVDVTHQSWGARIGESLKGIVFGLVLIPCSFALLNWNEERAVDRSSALAAAADVVISIPADRIARANDGKLVHVMGRATTEDELHDSEFDVIATGIKLVRTVEIYQWQETSSSETHQNLGGSTETKTTYKYSKGWASELANSSTFRKPAGHENPSYVPFSNTTYQAETVTIGAFRLSDAQVAALDETRPAPLRHLVPEPPTEIDGRPVTMTDNQFYVGANPNSPEVGDLRVRFDLVEPADISIIAQQYKDSFIPYAAPTGEIDLIEYGLKAPESMIRIAQRENDLMTWGLRLGGFLLMFMGFKLVFALAEVVTSFIPLLGWFTGAVSSLVAGILAFVLSLATIGTAWIVHHPLIGVGLGVAVTGALAAFWIMRRSRSAPLPPPL